MSICCNEHRNKNTCRRSRRHIREQSRHFGINCSGSAGCGTGNNDECQSASQNGYVARSSFMSARMDDDPGDFEIGDPERRWEVFPTEQPVENPAPAGTSRGARAPRKGTSMKSLFKIGEIISYRYWMWTHKGLFSPHTCKGWPKDIPMEGTFQKSSYLSFRGVYGIKDRSAMYEWLAREDVLDSLRRHWFSGPDYGDGFFE